MHHFPTSWSACSRHGGLISTPLSRGTVRNFRSASFLYVGQTQFCHLFELFTPNVFYVASKTDKSPYDNAYIHRCTSPLHRFVEAGFI